MARYPVSYRPPSRAYHDGGFQKARDRLTRAPTPSGKLRFEHPPTPYAGEGYAFPDDEGRFQNWKPEPPKVFRPGRPNPNRFGRRMIRRVPYGLAPGARQVVQWMRLLRFALDMFEQVSTLIHHGATEEGSCGSCSEEVLNGNYTTNGTNCAPQTFLKTDLAALRIIQLIGGAFYQYSTHCVIDHPGNDAYVQTFGITDYVAWVVNGGMAPTRGILPVEVETMPLPWLYPPLDPMGLPIGRTVPDPRPIPYRLVPYMAPNPDRVLGEQRDSGYATRTVTDTRSKAPGKQLSPRPKPKDLPLPEHELAPPKPRVKERKFIFALNQASLLGKIFNATTETRDFIEQLHYALPKQFWVHARFYKDPTGKWRKHNPSIVEMSWALWQHAAKLNVNKAIVNILTMEIGDAMAGTLGKHSGKAQRRLHDKGYSPPRNPGLYTRGF